MANDLTLTPKPTSPGSVSLSTPAQNGGSLSSNAIVPTDFATAPPGRQTATVDSFNGVTPGVGPTSIAWGTIAGNILAQIDLQAQFATKAGLAVVNAHLADFANPHHVTKAQVGLGLADNTPDASKPVSAAQAAAIAAAVTGPLPGATITASQISDAVTDPGRQVLTAANDAAARTALGSGAFGDGLFTAASLQAAQTALAMSAQPSFRNLIINGSMGCLQYDTPCVNVPGFMFDMFYCEIGTPAGTVTGSWQNPAVTPDEFPYCAQLLATGANAAPGATAFWGISQRIEGLSIRPLRWGYAAGKSVIVSFWAYSSVAGTYSVAIRNFNASRCYTKAYSIPVANVWTFVTILVPAPPATPADWDGGVNVGMNVWFAAGQGSTYAAPVDAVWNAGNYIATTGSANAMAANGGVFRVAGVQVEAGVVATPFEWRQFQVELSAERRYYQPVMAVYGVGTGSTTLGRMSAVLNPPMRNSPTIKMLGSVSLYNGISTGSMNTIGTNYSQTLKMEFDGTSFGSWGAGTSVISYNTDANNCFIADARF